MKKSFTIGISFILLLGCSKKEEKKPLPVYPVQAATAEKKDMPIYIETIGLVDPIVTVNVVSRVMGEITGVYFTEGAYIKEGDLLFTIDPRTFQATLDKAKAALKENIANLAFARDKVERYAVLTEEEYFSQVNFDNLTTNADIYEAVVQQNQADIDDAAVNLEYCWIYSPLCGRTGILQIDKGNVLKGDESQTLVTINQMQPIYVSYTIPERDLPKVQKYARKNPELKTLVAYQKFSEDVYEGKLEMIDNQVNTSTGMVKLRSIYDNHEEELWPGEFVRVRLLLYIQKDAIVVPFQAIELTAEGTFVYVIKKDETVEMRKVVLGQREDENIIIEKGVNEGEMLVTNGQVNLVNGSKISVVQTDAKEES